MKKIFNSLALIVTFILSHNNFALAFSKDVDTKLNDKLAEIVETYKFPGAVVGVWVPGEGEWVSAVGLADTKTKEKLTTQDHFRIGSVTKTFVVTALLQLVDQGKLSLDDTISKYIPNVPNGDKITLRQLASMTSGLPNYTMNKKWLEVLLKEPNKKWTPQELLDYAFSIPNNFKPGAQFEYSNTNTVLLGLVIEKIAGMPLGQVLEENIFKPLKLKNTLYPLNNKIPAPFAHGYAELPDKKIIDDTFHDPSWSFAAGTMVSDLMDLKVWAKALGTGEFLKPETFKERLTWDHVKPNTDERHYMVGVGYDNGWILHEGELPGYNAKIAYLPEKKAIFVALVNTDADAEVDGKRKSPTSLIFKEISQILFPKHVPIG